jgi:hypothetical protein
LVAQRNVRAGNVSVMALASMKQKQSTIAPIPGQARNEESSGSAMMLPTVAKDAPKLMSQKLIQAPED